MTTRLPYPPGVVIAGGIEGGHVTVVRFGNGADVCVEEWSRVPRDGWVREYDAGLLLSNEEFGRLVDEVNAERNDRARCAVCGANVGWGYGCSETTDAPHDYVPVGAP